MKAVLLILASLIAAGNAYAGDAGCGLGSVVIQKNSKGLQLLASTTNATLFSQPLGITSGTSGCSSSGIVKNDQQMEYFVEVNHDDLSREMAQGQGEKLNTLAALNGCATKDAQVAFAGMAQGSFEKIMPSADVKPSEMVQNIRTQAASDAKVSQLCRVVAVSETNDKI
jgi:hypothetical protein